jgi:hypothetical protein
MDNEIQQDLIELNFERKKMFLNYSPKIFAHQIFNGTTGRYPNTRIVEYGRPIDAAIFGL